MEIRKFNRHEHMDAPTREGILKAIMSLLEIEGTFPIQNCLYGFFDGFDYSERIPKMEEMELVKKQNSELYFKIMGFCLIVSKYPDGYTQV